MKTQRQKNATYAAMQRLLMAGIWILLLAFSGRGDAYVRQPHVDIIRYDIALELSDRSDSISGTAVIHARLQKRGITDMWLDFAGMQVDEVRMHGVRQAHTHSGGRLELHFNKPFAPGKTVSIEVRYHGAVGVKGILIGSNRYGRRVIFSHNWPDAAHYWFPCIDHPHDKAAARITVTAPAHYDVISNGRRMRTRYLADGRKVTEWRELKPIPTYSMAIGAAEFSAAQPVDSEGMPIPWHAFPEDAPAAARKFRRTAAALDFYRKLIGPYPYEKLAQIESIIPLGGMENASAIFYSESLFSEPSDSDAPVPHEIAHQWFGNSVTMADWDHLWLSEGFARYFEALFCGHLREPGSLQQIMENYADQVRAYAGARSVRIIDSEERDPEKKLTPVTYEKGAWVLHMLRGILGDTAFFAGIRRYYQAYANGTARSEDFQRVMESVSARSLETFFRQWLHQAGWPEYGIAWHWDAAAACTVISVRQMQAHGLYDMPVDVTLSWETSRETHKLRVHAAAQEFRIPAAAPPLALQFDPDGWLLKSLTIED